MIFIPLFATLAFSWGQGCSNAFLAGRRMTKPVGRLGVNNSSPPSIFSRLEMSSSSKPDNNGNGEPDELERLRQAASKLRAEAQAAEEALQKSGGRTASKSQFSSAEGVEYVKPTEYTDLNDSCWELTYRFSNEPESKNDNDDENNDKNNLQRIFYSGKLQLKFRNDGYTDVLSPSDKDEGNSSNDATFQKCWGWDLETSDQDSLDYILFSADVRLPPPISASERVYFQARVDRDDGKDVLSLRDGSVTVKRNIEAPAGGWWGIFRGADGILAQFRQVGEFRCRAIARPR